MKKKCIDHCERKNWKIFSIGKVPKEENVLYVVWAMRRKRNILTKETYRWKVPTIMRPTHL